MKNGQAESGDAVGSSVRLQLVANRFWKELSPAKQTHAFVASALQEMRGDYRLAFPVMVSGGRAFMGVALVARRDWRTSLIADIDEAPDATHLAIFLLFRDEAEWKAQADRFARLWPEQPEMPSRLIDAAGHESSFTFVDDAGTRV